MKKYNFQKPKDAFNHAQFLISQKKEVPQYVEELIATSGQFSTKYARLLEQRFEEGEHSIKKNAAYSVEYSIYILKKGRFREAEQNIMTEPEHAYSYVKNIIRDDWPELNDYILTNRGSAVWTNKTNYQYLNTYVLKYAKNRNPVFEKFFLAELKSYTISNVLEYYKKFRDFFPDNRWLELENATFGSFYYTVPMINYVMGLGIRMFEFEEQIINILSEVDILPVLKNGDSYS